MVDAEAVAYVDKLIEEYLLFRGFTQSLKTFQNEKKNDKTKGYKVYKLLIDAIFSSLNDKYLA